MPAPILYAAIFILGIAVGVWIAWLVWRDKFWQQEWKYTVALHREGVKEPV